ncbi:2TM domain-containing protein [Ramlibacter sp. H39-3-26]|uniref:2TM domain-containing protein n=1 Tax=Curvibacter soli TaxID=3031331 RepID=UPI0023DA8A9F|nr:2TM domain-containing protein [Ramlibacter sp. H39-3-26]MDF1485538.1 2TM domain-containing protein [Ramlibacter sp. H39-3-26]
MHCHDTPPDGIEQLARKRAGAKLGWYIHASIYIAVNLFLIALATHQGRHWAVFPALGWGLGLLVHATVAWLAMPGGSLYARLLQREREALQRAK